MLGYVAPALAVVAAVVVVMTVVRFETFCLRDIAAADEVRCFTKRGWSVLCVCCIPLGGIAYLLYGRAR